MSMAIARGDISDDIRAAAAGRNLSEEAMHAAVSAMLAGTATPAQIGALLIALKIKGETASEISGAARAMRQHAIPLRTRRERLLDVCGAGGDGCGTFNISTAAAFVAAGAGAAVAKHGNRAMSSRCGSADVLEALGVSIDAPPGCVRESLERHGIAFLFAQRFHPGMAHVAPVRKQLGVRTLFNVLGPLTNPARPTHQLVGVPEERLLTPVAEALRMLGVRRAAVVHARDGMDEISLCAPTDVVEWNGQSMRRYSIWPESFGASPGGQPARGGDAASNAAMLLAVLSGQHGPARDIALLNAAFALYIYGLESSLPAALAAARRSIDCGAARSKVEDLRKAMAA
jgi:anthranilate phosphoribosyltransferase